MIVVIYTKGNKDCHYVMYLRGSHLLTISEATPHESSRPATDISVK